jgi:7-cyano-7-deazaguanine reductase
MKWRLSQRYRKTCPPRPVALDVDACIGALAGDCMDALDVTCDASAVDSSLLRTETESTVEETLHTHLLRSLCPVTNQPDLGSLVVSYEGPRIDRAALLQYVVSYREHNDFHEACVERIFVDILEHCQPQRLSVCARYQRRGGIDINPFRSSTDERPDNTRTWRQ